MPAWPCCAWSYSVGSAFGAGTSIDRSVSHCAITRISGACAASMRAAAARTCSLVPRSGTSPAISSACRWCSTIICMNATSSCAASDSSSGSSGSRVALSSPGAPGWSSGTGAVGALEDGAGSGAATGSSVQAAAQRSRQPAATKDRHTPCTLRNLARAA